MLPIISLFVKFDTVITFAHKIFDSSFEIVPKSPLAVLLLAFLACVHIPSLTKDGSESLLRPFKKVLVSTFEVF